MEFCSVCGSRLRRVEDGYWCPKCDRTTECKFTSASEMKTMSNTKREQEPVLVIGEDVEQHAKTNQVCPICGNKEAYHWFSETLGEHAGVRQERTIEHFRCTKCSHSWNKGF